jgi:predicted ATPase
MYQRDAQAALVASDASLRYCQEQGAPFWLASGQIVQGWGTAVTGGVAQGLAQMRAGMAMYEDIGSNVVQPLWYALLTEVLLIAGEVDAAADAVATGMARATANGERISEAELWIACGDVGLARASAQGAADARQAYQRAVALSQTMGAVMLENRALQRLSGLPAVAE